MLGCSCRLLWPAIWDWGELVDRHVDLGGAPGRANTGNKIMTLVASAPRFRGGRVWLAATALTTPTCCAPAGRLARSAA